jgi:hypothetical protein
MLRLRPHKIGKLPELLFDLLVTIAAGKHGNGR